MTSVIDRREQSKDNSVVSRRRFLDRYKDYVKDAIEGSISDGKIKDLGKGGTDVAVPKRDIREPTIHHGKGGTVERVMPGNKEYLKGQRIPKPEGGNGQGGGNGPGAGQGQGEDDFTFHITEEEYYKYLFDDCELPNLNKRAEAADVKQFKVKHDGIVSTGPYSNLDIARSAKKKKSRTIPAEKPYNDRILNLLREEKNILARYDGPQAAPEAPAPQAWTTRRAQIELLESDIEKLKTRVAPALLPPAAQARVEEIEAEVEALQKRKGLIPSWNESTDLRFRHNVKEPVPVAKAVIFYLMDVSGSMGEEEKNNAKVFDFLLHRFVRQYYEHTEAVFIRHTDDAKEVDEQEFFNSRESGGTKVSSALELMQKIKDERYGGNDWNVYVAQATDGDNYPSDNQKCLDLLDKIVPQCQGYFYTQTDNSWGSGDLLKVYQSAQQKFSDRFWSGSIKQRKDIWPMFHGFFKKKDAAPDSNNGPGTRMTMEPQP